jgi:hypothetical protein
LGTGSVAGQQSGFTSLNTMLPTFSQRFAALPHQGHPADLERGSVIPLKRIAAMSHESALHKYTHKRLREVFGEPDHSLGRDDHWALRPGPDKGTINLLVNGTLEAPAVWVFDPHDHNDGVMRTAVQDEAHVDDIIKQIQERVKRAALPRGNAPSR